MAGFCEHGGDDSCPLNAGNFLTCQVTEKCSRNTLYHKS
jgi:hypothetical protein